MTERGGPWCGQVRRRTFLADVGWGITGLALGSMLQRDGITRAEEPQAWLPPDGKPSLSPKAKTVIWIFLSGGVSHLETWDPKPALNKYAGKTYDQTPYPNPTKLPLFKERSRAVVGDDRPHSQIYPLQVGFKKHGQAGVEFSDWWPHLATCVDDMAIVRSMYTTDNDHAAEFQFHHGRHKLDEKQPVIGSWIHYGLGTLNENLPQFVFLGQYKDPRVKEDFSADYLGPQYAGVELSLEPGNPLPFGSRLKDMGAEEQRQQFELIHDLNRMSSIEYPEDDQLRARIKAYELAFRMQRSVPEALDLASETAETLSLYGIDQENTATYGRRLLAAQAGRAWNPICAGLPQRLRRVGFPPRSPQSSCPVLRPSRSADRRAAQGPEAEGADRRGRRRLRHRVRPHTRPGDAKHDRQADRTRSSSARLHHLACRGGNPGRDGPRSDR